MDKLPIDDVIPYLESLDISKQSEALRAVESSLTENEHTLNLLIEHYYVTHSGNILLTINSLLTESRAQRMFDLVRDYTLNSTENLKATLSLLTKLLSRTDPEPTWMYLIVEHELFNIILTQLQAPGELSSIPLGLVFISMLVPLAPVSLSDHFDTLIRILSNALLSYHRTEDHCFGYIQRLSFHYFVTLYSIYPCKLLAWTQTLRLKSPASQFVQKCGPLLKLHTCLYSAGGEPTVLEQGLAHSDDYAHSIRDQESHDIIWEISCYTKQFDLLLEAKMVDEAQALDTTEHTEPDLQGIRSIGCQTEPCRSILAHCKIHARPPNVDEGMIRTYLDKQISASTSLFTKRRASKRYEPDDQEYSSPEMSALEGELMLEKYLRYQHERRNRRYLSNVRRIEEERSLNQYYKEDYTRLSKELKRAESKVAEQAKLLARERHETQLQLIRISTRTTEELAGLKSRNRELDESHVLNTKLVEQLEDKVRELELEKRDVMSVNRDFAEKVREINVLQINNGTLSNKMKQLQNQLFIVNEIRAYQCDALNTLKPFCFKPFIEGGKYPKQTDTPDVLNLRKLSLETLRKLELVETDLARLKSTNERQVEEMTGLKEKLVKQKDLTEKTTNFWEQKYSGLEKTWQTYKNTYHELSQYVTKLKRDLETKRGSSVF